MTQKKPKRGFKKPTMLESLTKILDLAKAKRLGHNQNSKFGNCSYLYKTGRTCAVGELFSKEQLQWIMDRELNEVSIYTLAFDSSIGQQNIEFVTGMSLAQLAHLQDVHDSENTMKLQNKAVQKEIEYILKHGNSSPAYKSIVFDV